MNVKMELTYKSPKGTETTFISEEMLAGKALVLAEDIEKTGRMKDVTFIDSKEHTWNLKELKELMKGIQTEPHHIKLYFDGGYNLETRNSGLGCVIYYEQSGKSYRLRKNAQVQELESNNEAEYAALHLGLQELEFLGVEHQSVEVIGDSKVVINQLTDEWPVLEEELSRWADRIEEKMGEINITPEYNAVSRKENNEADRLASQALKGVEVSSTIEIT
ncbi:reverse transcriptase-like protein [Pontibacillus sp. HMF3514]|uniref:reverse transcriptase-like protein n=1 Tax=Pontibacillus sp. HMF3514 TaxID=2692425 RepID=UPI00131FC1A7|nr:reverse transcriptase-like protein [Pontibacillus sp. HMF3514]QHE52804.1 reverse transcriptase-like protein [Pontibacillus sp. HMF3514]